METTYASSANEVNKLWSEDLYRDMIVEPFFAKMMGGSSSIVHVKKDLEASKGDRIRFTLRKKLSGSGVTGDTTLRGNEEKLSTYTSDVELQVYRHAVSYDALLSNQRVAFALPEEVRSAVKDWAIEKVDEICGDAIIAAPTKVVYSGSASATNNIADKITPAMISRAKAIATTGDHRTFIPIRPVKVDGGEYYVLLIHPDAGYDLRIDTTFAQANREAQVRGEKNPLFTGALGVWDNVIVKESERIQRFTNWGSGGTTVGQKAVFMGAQALVFGFGMDGRPQIVEDEFDYKSEKGVAIQIIAGVKKPTFDSKDYGSMGFYTAMTAI
jgi:N4-gp56 family major capsid protein